MSTHHMEPGLAAEAGRARGPVLSFTLHLAERVAAMAAAGHARGAAGRIVHAVSHRWPSLVALGLTFDSWFSPGLPPAVLLVALGAENLVIGLVRRQFADRRLLAAHVAGAAFYLVLAATAYTAGGRAGIVLTAAGWLLHTGWDGVLYRMNKVVWRWYAEACAVLDLVLGVTILFLL